MTYEIPERLVEHASGAFGGRGSDWLEQLPDILDRCAAKWELRIEGPVAEIKANYVGYATMADGRDVVLKVGTPHRDLETEMAALPVYGGRRMNRLIDHDSDLMAMLLERLNPGTMLSTVDDPIDRARHGGEVIGELVQTDPPVDHTFPHMIERLEKACRDSALCRDPDRARPYLEQLPRVEAMMSVLTSPDEPQRLLHGDCHHFNILFDEARGWIAIDPKGVVGASCLDVGAFVGNTIDDTTDVASLRKQLTDTIQALSASMGESEERVYAGAFYDKVAWSARTLKDEPPPWETHSRALLAAFLDVGEGVDLERVGLSRS